MDPICVDHKSPGLLACERGELAFDEEPISADVGTAAGWGVRAPRPNHALPVDVASGLYGLLPPARCERRPPLWRNGGERVQARKEARTLRLLIAEEEAKLARLRAELDFALREAGED